MGPQKLLPATNVIRIAQFSDGDPNHRPSEDSFSRSDPEPFMRKLATKWIEEEGGGLKPGGIYTLDKLPSGYALFERSRRSNPNHIDRYLFGHPSHVFFDSPYRFYPHFKYLMKHQQEDVCSCDFCTTRKRSGAHKELKSTAKMNRPRGRPQLTAKSKDEEGSPLIFSHLLELLQQERKLERIVQENQSMDWRAERALVPIALGEIAKQPSFVPRVGELVIWCRMVHGEIRQNNVGEYMFFDEESKIFTRYPSWMGGVVTQVPIASQPVVMDDILRETQKDYAVNSSGFRIECYPDPNSEDKNFSKQYTYVPLHHIRPMIFWKDIFTGLSREDWHPTIKNCLTAMATFSPIERYRFRGVWPNANVYSKGCFLGAESIFVGDTVRLMPERKAQVTDVLRVTDVVIKLMDIQPKNQGVTGEDASHIHILFHGYGYTLNIKRSESRLPARPDKPEKGISPSMQGYGQWYHISQPGDLLSVSYSSVLGRLFEFEAIQKWTRDRSNAVDAGCSAIIESRQFAQKNDARLKLVTPIFLSDSRVEALDLPTFNGLDVGPKTADRDPKTWRDALAVIDGVKNRVTSAKKSAISNPSETIAQPPKSGSPPGKEDDGRGPSTIGFSPVNDRNRNQGMVQLALESESEGEAEGEGEAEEEEEREDEELEGVIGGLISGEALGGEDNEGGDNDDDDDGEDELALPEKKRVKV